MQQLQTSLPVGSILRERYLIEGLLGKGGYGSVYLVRDLRVKQNLYALKENHSPEKMDRQRFFFEGELLTRLDHRSLPRVYRVFKDDTHQRSFMLMDYIEGSNLESLRQRQSGNRLRLSQVLAIMAPIIEAVSYLHNQPSPILHRDIKPSNIIVPHSGDEAVLVDFGIAKEYEPDGTTTAFRTGSPGYAAPEQYSRGTSTRSDIYGLGATFYTLLTGALPADALYRMTTTGSGQPDPLEPPNKLNPAIPSSIAQAIQKAMSLNARERFATVEQFWQAFAAHDGWQPLRTSDGAQPLSQASTPVKVKVAVADTPPPFTVTPHDEPKSRRFKRIFLLLPLLLLLISSGTLLGLFFYSASHPGAHGIDSHLTSVATTSGSTPISLPTAKPTTHQPRPVPTPTHPARPVATPTSPPVTPTTPVPTMQPTPRPTPTPSPPPVPVPDITGTYNGNIHDATANIVTGMALTIHQKQNQGSINGYFTVNTPLVGSGNFNGTVNNKNYVQFTVKSYKGNAPLYFWGWVQSDGSIMGDYCSINAQNQCDSKTGASGTWDVAQVASPQSGLELPHFN